MIVNRISLDSGRIWVDGIRCATQINITENFRIRRSPISPTYVEGSMGSRAAGIRQRDALPSPIHETEMPEICLPLHKRPYHTTPGLGYEAEESSAAGAARQVGPTTARADLYGFADMLDAAPGR
ncbi:hypothetical protein Tco_0634547 [Tanacetum coccineum]